MSDRLPTPFPPLGRVAIAQFERFAPPVEAPRPPARAARASRPLRRSDSSRVQDFPPTTRDFTQPPPRRSASLNQHVVAERSDERFIIDGDDDDAVVGDGVAAPVLLEGSR
jgi:hypothetical protein